MIEYTFTYIHVCVYEYIYIYVTWRISNPKYGFL